MQGDSTKGEGMSKYHTERAGLYILVLLILLNTCSMHEEIEHINENVDIMRTQMIGLEINIAKQINDQ